MAPDVAPIERIEERPISVDPRAIEEEFARIWAETSGAGFDESSIRLRVLNFVALAHGGAEADRFEQAMQLLPERHPCRGILALTAGPYTALEATISAHCWRSPGGKRHLCSEEVLLTGAPSQERELASAVLALLVPEVPVALWILGSLGDGSYLSTELLEPADCVFFDSARSTMPREAYDAALKARTTHDVQLADLAWGRSETWRVLAAQLFDGEDGPRELSQLQSIEIMSAAGSSDALLLAGWFVSRLGLTLADLVHAGDRIDATLYKRSGDVRLSVAPSAGEASGIERLRLKTLDAEFVIGCHPESGHMHVEERWDGGDSRRIVQQMPVDDAALIERELDSGSSAGDVYIEAVRSALTLIAT